MRRAKLTTKKLAQRIDLNYFKRSHPFRRLRFILSISLPLLALIWLGWFAIASPAILMVLGTGLVFLGGGKKAYPRG